jgi:hypothetical protein
MVQRKPVPQVTKKPEWLTGVIVPTMAGIFLGIVLPSNTTWSWYALAGWQALFAVALVLDRAPMYGATSVPQSRRLCELYALSWFGMTAVTILAMTELATLSRSLATHVLAIDLTCTLAFSIGAGPTRLVNANDIEMKLVPINSFLVGWAAGTLYVAAAAA